MAGCIRAPATPGTFDALFAEQRGLFSAEEVKVLRELRQSSSTDAHGARVAAIIHSLSTREAPADASDAAKTDATFCLPRLVELCFLSQKLPHMSKLRWHLDAAAYAGFARALAGVIKTHFPRCGNDGERDLDATTLVALAACALGVQKLNEAHATEAGLDALAADAELIDMLAGAIVSATPMQPAAADKEANQLDADWLLISTGHNAASLLSQIALANSARQLAVAALPSVGPALVGALRDERTSPHVWEVCAIALAHVYGRSLSTPEGAPLASALAALDAGSAVAARMALLRTSASVSPQVAMAVFDAMDCVLTAAIECRPVPADGSRFQAIPFHSPPASHARQALALYEPLLGEPFCSGQLLGFVCAYLGAAGGVRSPEELKAPAVRSLVTLLQASLQGYATALVYSEPDRPLVAAVREALERQGGAGTATHEVLCSSVEVRLLESLSLVLINGVPIMHWLRRALEHPGVSTSTPSNQYLRTKWAMIAGMGELLGMSGSFQQWHVLPHGRTYLDDLNAPVLSQLKAGHTEAAKRKGGYWWPPPVQPKQQPSGTSPSLPKCAFPGCTKARATPAQLLACAGCNSAHYCDQECQRAHWGAHKSECKRLAALAREKADDAQVDAAALAQPAAQ